jgi:hypothetical protein
MTYRVAFLSSPRSRRMMLRSGMNQPKILASLQNHNISTSQRLRKIEGKPITKDTAFIGDLKSALSRHRGHQRASAPMSHLSPLAYWLLITPFLHGWHNNGPPQKHSAGYESLGSMASHPGRVACEACRYEVVLLSTNRLTKPKRLSTF